MNIEGLTGQSLRVGFAETADDIAEAQRLRYQVFAHELGAAIGNRNTQSDSDHFDPHCTHMIVREDRGPIVAYSRILTDDAARRCGGFYSENEFDLAPIRALNGRVMEVGRTCVHVDYRRGPAITLLLLGLARFMEHYAFDYLIGCGSVPLKPARAQALRSVATLIRQHGCPEPVRVAPRNPFPDAHDPQGGDADDDGATPALLRTYIRLGAYVGGAPCFDPEFDVADVLIVLFRKRFDHSYLERLLARACRPHKQHVA